MASFIGLYKVEAVKFEQGSERSSCPFYADERPQLGMHWWCGSWLSTGPL